MFAMPFVTEKQMDIYDESYYTLINDPVGIIPAFLSPTVFG